MFVTGYKIITVFCFIKVVCSLAFLRESNIFTKTEQTITEFQPILKKENA